MATLQDLNDHIQSEAQTVQQIVEEVKRVIVGQDILINRLLIALLCNNHALIEGVPGLAKTLTIRILASTIEAQFQRIQFTPDLLPADLIGTQIYNPQSGDFSARPGPIFSNIILADEINRAPAKVQSALLEAMAERQVTLGDETRTLDDPFLVLATQNPIEQEGTYPLPEAQLDRFMLKITIDYPTRENERQIIDRAIDSQPEQPRAVIDSAGIRRLRRIVSNIYVDPRIKEYVLDIVAASRSPAENGVKNLENLIQIGASPRASIFLVQAAQAHAFLGGRGYVTPEDVKRIGFDVLRHRIAPSFEAEAENITSDQIVAQLFQRIQVP